ncbi:TSUP family transporter, partial [Escherichia coli]|nr:TSUP family transporter [Escherichia coli]
MIEFAVVTVASLFAGFVDAIVGGGGLILVPALFSTFPSAAPATLFGTNKGAAVWGTAWATVQYARRVEMVWS